MNKKRIVFLIIGILLLGFIGQWTFKNYNFNSKYEVGQKIDSLNNVYVFYNGGVSNISGRNLTADGYNLGMSYQCVEFVKRYYYEYLQHKMPDSYGNAKDFFDHKVFDGQRNEKRNLNQYTNPSQSQPKIDDLLIFDGTIFNTYGHVAIITSVTKNEIELFNKIQGLMENQELKLNLNNNKMENGN